MIYFSDDYNFRPANFPALFAWLKNSRRSFDFDAHAPALKKRWGDYADDFSLAGLPPLDEIGSETYQGINLYDIYEPELLYACASAPIWPQLDPPVGRQELIQYLYPLFPNAFSLCRSAAIKWIDHWREQMPDRVTAGISFGGSLIYANAFARVLAAEGLDSLFVEHFFTGHDFYFEKRVEPLPNDSILRDLDYCRDIEKETLNSMDRHLKIQRAQNKNVRQPAFKMPQKSGYALILAQVSNDFSILSRTNPFKNSVGFYQKLIDAVLEQTDLEVIVKTHPYEAQKVKPSERTTFARLNGYLSGKPSGQRRRVELVDNMSLSGLINRSSVALTLNSQAGLEALLQGKPLVCFGRPFYGHKGFTLDLDSLDLSGIDGLSLSVKQFEKFLSFLEVAFEHLVGDGEEHKIEAVLGRISDSQPQMAATAGLRAKFTGCFHTLGSAARRFKSRLQAFQSKDV